MFLGNDDDGRSLVTTYYTECVVCVCENEQSERKWYRWTEWLRFLLLINNENGWTCWKWL